MRDRQLTREHEAILALLRRWLRPGDTVLTRVLHTSRSGLERVVGAWAVDVPERTALVALTAQVRAMNATQHAGIRVAPEAWSDAYRLANEANSALIAQPRTIRLFVHAARVLNRRADTARGGIVYRGGNFDACDEIVRDLGVALYGDAQAFTNEEL